MQWIFFFPSRRRHTRWTGDWSSDVCSSDLDRARWSGGHDLNCQRTVRMGREDADRLVTEPGQVSLTEAELAGLAPQHEIGRASGRERGQIEGDTGGSNQKVHGRAYRVEARA